MLMFALSFHQFKIHGKGNSFYSRQDTSAYIRLSYVYSTEKVVKYQPEPFVV